MKQLFNSRSKIVVGILFLVFFIFAVTLFVIQIIRHDYYLAVTDDQKTTKLTIKATRGQIYIRDRNNFSPLVLNEPVYTIFADPQEIDNKDKVIDLIRKTVPDLVIPENLELLDNKKIQYVVLAKQVSRKDAVKIKDAKLDGVGVQQGTRRMYPEEGLAGQTLGFVNIDGFGQYGIEQYLDDDLAGVDGVLKSTITSSGIPLTIGANDVRIPAVNGKNIVLTLDRNIQTQAELFLKNGLNRVSATKGSILVMDPQNGEVLAMANYPSYNPGQFYKVMDADLFQNRVVSYPYEPGSVTKTLTTAAALNSAAITSESRFVNNDCVQIYDAEICNVSTVRGKDGIVMGPLEVLQFSLNTGAIWMLESMGGGEINYKAKQTLYEYFHDRYLMTKKTGIEQAGEAIGMINKPDSVEGGPVNYANMSFGQGFTTTMIEMASAFSASINGGTFYRPHLVYGHLSSENKLQKIETDIIKTEIVSETTSKQLVNMMIQARQLTFSDNRDNGYFVGAKSGTAQIYDPTTGKYSEDITVGTYLGFGADKSKTPRYVIIVRVDDPRTNFIYASDAASPIFTEMSNYIINYLGISK